MPFGHITAKFQVNRSGGGGGLLQSFFEQELMKNKGYEHFYFCLKWLKFVVQFGVRKTIVDHKISFRMNKPGFRGLMSELVTRSLLRRPTFITSYL